MQIVGITGMAGAGKGTIVEYLVNNKGFKHYSVGEYLFDELQKQGKDLNRDNQIEIANKIRSSYGPDYITKILFNKAKTNKENAIIESIRNPQEVEFIKSEGGIMLAVTANQKARFKRIKMRKSKKDNVTFKQFKIQEKKESQNIDPNAQNLPKCIEMSDFIINNDGSIENLYEQIEKINL